MENNLKAGFSALGLWVEADVIGSLFELERVSAELTRVPIAIRSAQATPTTVGIASLSVMTSKVIKVSVTDPKGIKRCDYEVDMTKDDEKTGLWHLYFKACSDFRSLVTHFKGQVLTKKKDGLEISPCWKPRVYDGLLCDGDELVVRDKHDSGMVRFDVPRW